MFRQRPLNDITKSNQPRFTKYDIKKKKEETITPKRRFKAWLWLIIIGIIISPVAFSLWKTVQGANKISIGDGENLFSSLTGLFTNKALSGEDDDRINILLLGMRGEDYSNGGLLADTIMIFSYKPSTKQVAMISVPRDLYVLIPGGDKKVRKINSVHAIGETKEENGGLEYMANTVASVLDLPIHYTVKVDFTAFKESIDALGGIDIYLEEPFSEPTQFNGESFYLPAGENHLDGEKARMYVQARFASSDFDRARRQQQVIKAMKEKATSLGFLANPKKINDLINAISDHVRTDMKTWEMTKFIKIIKDLDLDKAIQFVFDNSEEGLLYSTTINGSYALRPVDNDFTKMREKVENIFEEE